MDGQIFNEENDVYTSHDETYIHLNFFLQEVWSIDVSNLDQIHSQLLGVSTTRYLKPRTDTFSSLLYRTTHTD